MGLVTKLISFWLITQLFFVGPAGPSTFAFLDKVRIDRMVFVCIITWFIILVITRHILLPKISAIEWFSSARILTPEEITDRDIPMNTKQSKALALPT